MAMNVKMILVSRKHYAGLSSLRYISARSLIFAAETDINCYLFCLVSETENNLSERFCFFFFFFFFVCFFFFFFSCIIQLDKKGIIRNRYNRILHPALNTKRLRSERSGVRDLPPPCCVLEQDTLLPESTG